MEQMVYSKLRKFHKSSMFATLPPEKEYNFIRGQHRQFRTYAKTEQISLQKTSNEI